RTFPVALWTSTPTPWPGGNTTAVEEEKCVFDEEFKFILLPISYGFVFVVGLPLNSWALWIFVSRMRPKRPWNATTTYMFNLAVSDTLYVLSLPTLVYYYADRNNWPFGEGLCKIVRFIKDNTTLCHDTTKPEEFDHYVHYSSSVMALLFGVPFLVIVLCYCLMAKRLCKPSFPSPSTRTPSYKKRSIKMIIIVLTVFAICFVPFHVTRTLY
ncbi:P2Y purinoceptor 4, partial [Colius striatus]